MPKIRDVCPKVRSKVAGPFWVTIDLFFSGKDTFDRYHDNSAIRAEGFAKIFGAKPELVSIYPVANLNMVKISYPRPTPQGGMVERDLHSGQQYVRLLDVELT